MKARDLRIYAWMAFVLFNFFIGFKYLLSMIMPPGWPGIIAAAATLFSFYFFEEFYRKKGKDLIKKKEEIGVDYTSPDWFIDRERRLYEEWLEQPLKFSEKAGNLWRVFKWKMKHRIFINWFHELPMLFRRWYHRKRMAENWIKYMEGVSRSHERSWRREEAIVEKEFNIRMIYKDREVREQMKREAVIEKEFNIRMIYLGGKNEGSKKKRTGSRSTNRSKTQGQGQAHFKG